MVTLDVACFNEQGVDIVVVFVDRELNQQQTNALQICANNAGLNGVAVPVWQDPFGNPQFLAPLGMHPFFTTVDWRLIQASINGQLTCG